MKGAADEFGNPLGAVDLSDPLRQLAEECLDVDLLEGLALAHVAGDLTEKQDHRRRVLPPDMKPGRGVGRARPARRHDDARASRQLPPGLCRHRCTAFLAAGGDLDRRIVERVEQREIALARHAEGAGHAVPLQGIGQDSAAGPGCRHGMSVRSPGATNLAGLKLSYKSRDAEAGPVPAANADDRCAQPVMRFSSRSMTAYMTMPSTASTTSPAEISGTLKCAWSDIVHRHHDEGVQFPVIVADRDIFARHEPVARQLETGLVALVAVDIVGEAP